MYANLLGFKASFSHVVHDILLVKSETAETDALHCITWMNSRGPCSFNFFMNWFSTEEILVDAFAPDNLVRTVTRRYMICIFSSDYKSSGQISAHSFKLCSHGDRGDRCLCELQSDSIFGTQSSY